jgi:hypothetical protein
MSDVGPVGGAVIGQSKVAEQAVLFVLPFRPLDAGGIVAANTATTGAGDVEMGGVVGGEFKHRRPRIRALPSCFPYCPNINEYDYRDPAAGIKHENYMRAMIEDVAVGIFDKTLKNLNYRVFTAAPNHQSSSRMRLPTMSSAATAAWYSAACLFFATDRLRRRRFSVSPAIHRHCPHYELIRLQRIAHHSAAHLLLTQSHNVSTPIAKTQVLMAFTRLYPGFARNCMLEG